jgi:hypothetical protein
MSAVISMESAFDRDMNRKERMDFVRWYAAWVKEVPNSTWSAMQADIIDSFLANAENFALSRKQYLAMKRSRCRPSLEHIERHL